LPTDFLAILDQNAVLVIDEYPQHRMPALSDKFDTPALIAERLDHRGQQGLQLLKLARHLNPLGKCFRTNKKWAKRPSLDDCRAFAGCSPTNKKPLKRGSLTTALGSSRFDNTPESQARRALRNSPRRAKAGPEVYARSARLVK